MAGQGKLHLSDTGSDSADALDTYQHLPPGEGQRRPLDLSYQHKQGHHRGGSKGREITEFWDQNTMANFRY